MMELDNKYIVKYENDILYSSPVFWTFSCFAWE